MAFEPGQITIRTIRPEDAEALRDLRLEALRLCPSAFSSDLAETEARPAEWWREIAWRKSGGGPEVIFVAADGARLVGMVGVWGTAAPKQAHRGDVWGVYVRADARRRGVAGRLLDAALAWARQRGLLLLTLAVTAGNQTARRCYERAGFTVYGVQPMVVCVDGVFHDELLMAKRL